MTAMMYCRPAKKPECAICTSTTMIVELASPDIDGCVFVEMILCDSCLLAISIAAIRWLPFTRFRDRVQHLDKETRREIQAEVNTIAHSIEEVAP